MSIEQGKYVFASASPATTGAFGSAPIPIPVHGAAEIIVPGGDMLLHADFARAGADLLITAPDGTQFVIVDYFSAATEAGLMTEGGALLPYDLVSALAGPVAPGQYAQSEDGIEEAPIGRVDETVGEVTATRVDGTTVVLNKDSSVFQGDILETGSGGAVAVVFIDETEFSLGEEGRMVLDELIFDPTSLEGSSSFSVVQGVFVFVSGEIAANNPDEMLVRTPVATLGIRGTKVAGKAAAEGELNTVTMMPEGPGQEVTGTITVSTQTTSITLNTAYQTTAVSSVFDSPTQPITLSAAQAGGLYGAVSNLLPATTSDNAAGPGGNDDAGGGGGADDGGGVAGDGQGAEAGADGEGGDEDGEGGAEGDVAGEGEGAEGEGEELDAAGGDLESGPDGPAEGDIDAGPDGLGPDGGLADGPAPGQEGFESADGGPTEEEIAAAGFAAANDAFAALEAAIDSGENLEDAFDIAVQAGLDAMDQYNDAIQEGVFNTLIQGGEFGDPEFFDGGPLEGFDDNPEQFSDEFAGFEGGFEGDFEGGLGPQDGEIDPEVFDEGFEGEFDEFGPGQEFAGEVGPGEFGEYGGFDPFGGPGGFGFGGPGGFGPDFGFGFGPGPIFGFDPDIIIDPFFGFGPGIDPNIGGPPEPDDELFIEEFFGGQLISDVSEFTGDPAVLANGLVDALSGLTLVAESGGPGPATVSASFIGNTNPGSSSAGFLESLNFGTVDGESFSLGKGILLTSGNGTPNNTNSAIGFTGFASGTSDSDLDTELSNTGHAQTTTDTTSLEFDFTVTGNVNAIIFDFMFGTDEFNEQGINDIAAVFVDGTNFALFPDDSILHFDIGANEFNFFDNTGGALGIEYDGISEPEVIVGLLNTGLSTHTVKIAVSDTSDVAVDTGLFLSAFGLGETFASASAGNDILAGTTGNDSVSAGNGNDSVFGAAGLDTLNGDGGDDKLHGGAGNDIVNGGADNDILDGASGNDTLNGGDGDDTVGGGFGDDTVRGGIGNDVLFGDAGNDTLVGESGNDFLEGDDGNDTLIGNSGADTLDGGLGNDTMLGGTGNDLLDGNLGDDLLLGEDNDDILDGGSGNDTLRGGNGNDTLDGNFENDVVEGGAGNDILNGGEGNDNITGGTGIDIATGDAGVDNFSFTNPNEGQSTVSNGEVTIGGGFHNFISDFASGVDCFLLTNGVSDFNLGSLSNGSNFFTIASQFNGTNSGASGTSPYLVVDSTKTLYYDDNGNDGAGYTVVAESGGGAPQFTDVFLV